MKIVRLTEKEIDAIRSMLEYFSENNDNGFYPRSQILFSQKSIEKLDVKLKE